MANENWRNGVYGTLENSGKERAIDYLEDQSAMAPVRAVLLMNENEEILGLDSSPLFITGNVSDEWAITAVNEVTPSDNDKTLSVPADREYQVLSIAVDYYAFGDAGTRQLELDFRDSTGNTFAQIRPGVTQTANTTGHYVFAPSLADHLSFRDTNYLMTPLPPTLFLQPSEDVRIFDNNDITANDTMVVRVRVAERAT